MAIQKLQSSLAKHAPSFREHTSLRLLEAKAQLGPAPSRQVYLVLKLLFRGIRTLWARPLAPDQSFSWVAASSEAEPEAAEDASSAWAWVLQGAAVPDEEVIRVHVFAGEGSVETCDEPRDAGGEEREEYPELARSTGKALGHFDVPLHGLDKVHGKPQTLVSCHFEPADGRPRRAPGVWKLTLRVVWERRDRFLQRSSALASATSELCKQMDELAALVAEEDEEEVPSLPQPATPCSPAQPHQEHTEPLPLAAHRASPAGGTASASSGSRRRQPPPQAQQLALVGTGPSLAFRPPILPDELSDGEEEELEEPPRLAIEAERLQQLKQELSLQQWESLEIWQSKQQQQQQQLRQDSSSAGLTHLRPEQNFLQEQLLNYRQQLHEWPQPRRKEAALPLRETRPRPPDLSQRRFERHCEAGNLEATWPAETAPEACLRQSPVAEPEQPGLVSTGEAAAVETASCCSEGSEVSRFMRQHRKVPQAQQLLHGLVRSSSSSSASRLGKRDEAVKQALQKKFPNLLVAFRAFDGGSSGLVCFVDFERVLHEVCASLAIEPGLGDADVQRLWASAKPDQRGFLSMGKLGAFLGLVS